MSSIPARVIHAIGTVVATSLLLGVGCAHAEGVAEPNVLQVPFLTVRNSTGSAAPEEAFGGGRSDLKAGWCRLRSLDLSVLAPLAEAAPAFVREELLRVDQVSGVPAETLVDEVRQRASTAAPLLYVHGYHISFEKGCRRAALFGENADVGDRLLWFSWPSDGNLASYTHDEADLYWSVPDIADAIIDLAQHAGNGVVDVVGHSLGARGVVLALYDVANRRPDIQLGEVVLVAADMDFGIFQRILPRISQVAANMTIYVAQTDRPLALSEGLHGYPRLGQAGNDVATLAGVEVIDTSDLPAATPIGHIYHIYSETVGDDLAQLLNYGRRAGQRRHMLRQGANIWRLQPMPEELRERLPKAESLASQAGVTLPGR